MSCLDRTLRLAKGGVELVYTVTGSGPTVVLLHAGGERREVWSPVAARLAAAGMRCVSVDQRGHGSSGGNGHRLSDFVDDACALIERVASPVVLVGCSLGGLVALQASVRSTSAARVAAIVLVDVVPDPDPERARAYLRGIESQHRPWNWGLVDDILAQAAGLRAAAARSTVAIALVRGEHGRVDEQDRARLRALVPSLVERLVAGAGHLVARDRPEQLADALIDLLSFLPSPSWKSPQR